jgi:hypothetical protein
LIIERFIFWKFYFRYWTVSIVFAFCNLLILCIHSSIALGFLSALATVLTFYNKKRNINVGLYFSYTW